MHSTRSLNIFITGGASGIGLGIARHLGGIGHQIILSDINQQALNSAVDALNQDGISARGIMLDASNPVAIKALAEQLPEGIDVLINNAGMQHVCRLEDFPHERWQLLVNLMLTGPAMLTQAFLPKMRERNFGRIINVGSIHSLIASPFKSAYVAAKHGLIGFSKTVALENGDRDITINTLCPSYVKTPLVEKQIAATAEEYGMSEAEVVEKIMLEPMPKKAFIGIEELAATAEFLMSDGARNMTAQTLVLDGGWTAR